MTRILTAAVLVAVVAWAALDRLQSDALTRIYEREYTARLQDQAVQDRLRFDAAVREAFHGAQMTASLRHVINQVDLIRRQSGNWIDPDVTLERPSADDDGGWLPSRSLIRSHYIPDHFILLDPLNRARRIFSPTSDELPNSFSKPLSLLVAKSLDQPLITSLNGQAMIISSARITGFDGTHMATLMTAAQLNTRFLRQAQQGYQSDSSIIALVDGADNKIIASTDKVQLPAGDDFSVYADDFLITGKGFFDYGSSEIKTDFLTLIPRAQFKEVLEPVLEVDRRHRTVLAVLFTALLLVF